MSSVPSLALAFSIPILAATVAFVTYSESSRGFDVAIIFSSLSLFNVRRRPAPLPASRSPATARSSCASR
jgi:ATP-binding cassette subfamily C (CFTR/MRP) protein 1